MNLKLLVWDLSIVAVCYLVITMPAVFAVNVKIISGGSTVGTIQYKPGDFVSISSSEYDSGIPPIRRDQDFRVDLVIENKTIDGVIESGKLYLCKGKDPVSCYSSVTPEEFSGRFEKTYNWVNIRDKDSPAHDEVSNFVVLTRIVKSGKAFWTGYHYQIHRYGENSFESRIYDVSGIEVHAKGGFANSINNFIVNDFMIPFNPAWVEKVVLSGVNYMFEFYSNTPPSFETGIEKDDEIVGLGYDYGIVFSNSSSGVFNGITLNLNPSYSCGDDICDTGLGESSVNCCLDCGCVSGFYCDAVNGCKNKDLIGLSLYGTQNMLISNCYQAHTINLGVRVDNPPSDMVVTGTSYVLGGESHASSACSPVSGGVYTCQINVPAVPGCSGGTTTIGPNSISFDISYKDGLQDVSKSLSTAFPDISIGSFDCGDGVCQTDLGESPSSCCYDCDCSFGYCDIESLQEKDSGTCRADFDNSNLIVSLDKSDFDSYTEGGESVSLDMMISDVPSSMVLSGEICEIGCEIQGGTSCSSSCGLSCSTGVTQNNILEKTCSMSFEISNYDNNNEYRLSPVVNVTARYYDGSDYTMRALSDSLNMITIKANWCGDGYCQGGSAENANNCCFDCGCPGDRYCETKTRESPSEGDMCMDLGVVDLSIQEIGPFVFSDSAVQNTINIEASISNPPSGLVVIPSCEIFGDAVGCSASCEGNSSGSEYQMDCEVMISPVDYKREDIQDVYDSVNHKIRLSDNKVIFTLNYNEGLGFGEKVITEDLQDIEMGVIWHCGDGNGVCETNLGESPGNCCVDCGCPEGDFCHVGNTLHGECINRGDILGGEVSIEPEPMICKLDIGNKDKCLFSNPRADALIEIINLPVGSEIIDSSYSIKGMNCRTNSTECAMSCYLNENPTGYDCSFLVPHIDSSSPGDVTFDVDFHLTVQHPVNSSTNLVFTEDFLLSGTLVVGKRNSERLQTCNSMKDKMEAKEERTDMIEGFAYTFLGIAIIYTLGCCIAQNWECCSTGGYVISCLIAGLLPLLGTMKQNLLQMKSEYASMCGAEDLDDLQDSTEEMNTVWHQMVGVVAGVVCIAGAMGGAFGSNAGTTNSEGSVIQGSNLPKDTHGNPIDCSKTKCA